MPPWLSIIENDRHHQIHGIWTIKRIRPPMGKLRSKIDSIESQLSKAGIQHWLQPLAIFISCIRILHLGRQTCDHVTKLDGITRLAVNTFRPDNP